MGGGGADELGTVVCGPMYENILLLSFVEMSIFKEVPGNFTLECVVLLLNWEVLTSSLPLYGTGGWVVVCDLRSRSDSSSSSSLLGLHMGWALWAKWRWARPIPVQQRETCMQKYLK